MSSIISVAKKLRQGEENLAFRTLLRRFVGEESHTKFFVSTTGIPHGTLIRALGAGKPLPRETVEAWQLDKKFPKLYPKLWGTTDKGEKKTVGEKLMEEIAKLPAARPGNAAGKRRDPARNHGCGDS